MSSHVPTLAFAARALVAVVLGCAAGALPDRAAAQMQSRAYAPENLRQLPVQDRVRVIEREYEDQSGGRAIPDNQLEFYLDQVQSGWGFSRIQEDIATSLRGQGNGGWRPGAGWTAREVVCTSDDNRYRECRTPFRGRAVVTQQISNTNCREGLNWGQRAGVVWVNGGCRARFGQLGGGGDTWYGGRGTVTCASNDRRRQSCAWNQTWGRPRLVEQQSDAACTEGVSWGYDYRGLWVDRGCRGRFATSR